MSSDGEFDTSRTAVKTYVPAYQKEEWAEHAEALGMSQSEFLRTMVQAGRRGFEVATTEEPAPGGTNPRGGGLEDRVLGVLEERGPLGFDELVAALSEDLEDRLEDALDDLQGTDRVRHRARAGYDLAEGSR